MEYVWSRYTTANHDLISANFGGQSSGFYSNAVGPTVRQAGAWRLDQTLPVNPDQANTPFQLSDIDPAYSGVRQHGKSDHDMSLMKRLRFTEGAHLQLRAEAENLFNIRGCSNYQTDPRSTDYGLMIAESGFNHTPRRIQMSARIVF